MTRKSTATRRSFIRTTGAALSGPVALAVASAPHAAGATPVDDAGRLARLEDRDAIRSLNQAFARAVNAGDRAGAVSLFAEPSDACVDHAMTAITAQEFGEADALELAPDRQTATARLHGTVTLEAAIGPDCPLVRMARGQGGGVVTRTARGHFENVYVRRGDRWRFARSVFHAE